LKLVLEEAMETIQDVRDGVKELQLLRAQVSFPFEMKIVQVIIETQCVLYI
jgi:hypothetical protein